MSQGIVSVYIGETLPERLPFPILNRHFGKPRYEGKKPFRAIFDDMDFSFITITDDPARADFLMVPHNYAITESEQEYIARYIKLSKQYNKKILLFHYSDEDTYIEVPNSYVFCYGQYRYTKRSNEITIAPQVYASDVFAEEMYFPREKKGRPVVGFCGWADFQSLRQRARYYQKLLTWDFRKFVLRHEHAEAHKQGVYFRRRVMRVLKKSPHVETSFIVRDFYTANKHARRLLTPEELRKEYIQNIQNSDFVLAPRGDGNESVRFYEALALGRIPVLIDTERVLPLEDEIPYRDFAVVVPGNEVHRTGEYIARFYNNLSPAEFIERQKRARDTFHKYLRLDSFLKYVLPQLPK